MRSSTCKAAIGLLLLASIPTRAQLSPSPPQGPLWEEQATGDAVQKDLGFIVPKRWKNFEREGFTSTRADGASTKALSFRYYQYAAPVHAETGAEPRGYARQHANT